MNFLKKTVLSVSLSLLSLLANAVELRKVMIVELDGNERATFSLSETPNYWLRGATLCVRSSSAQSEYELSSVTKIHFSNVDPTLVDELGAEKISLYPNPVQDLLIVSGMEENALVNLTNSEGVMLDSFFSVENGDFRLQVDNLPAGVYFLNINNRSFKFVKK